MSYEEALQLHFDAIDEDIQIAANLIHLATETATQREIVIQAKTIVKLDIERDALLALSRDVN